VKYMIDKSRLPLIGLCVALAGCAAESSRDLTAPDAGAEPFQPAALALANTWATRAQIFGGANFAAAGAINNMIYFVGGRSGSTNLKTVRAYNITTNSWSTKASLPTNRSSPNGASNIGGQLYVSGGISNTGGPGRTLYAYFPGSNFWVRRANMPVAGACGAQGVIGGLLYVYFPGHGGCGSTQGFYRYNPASDSWTARALPPSVHGSPVAGVIAGKFYLAGGTLNSSLDPNLALHVYTPATNSWATRAPLPSKQQNAAGGALLGKLYVAGGIDFTPPGGGLPVAIPTVRAYDPGTNSWSNKASMPTPRYYAAGTNAAGQIWVISGSGQSSEARNKNEAYTP
jgi:N-acetylneuraminic acid mutarotase